MGVRISKAACFVGLVVGSVNLELKLYSVRSLEEVGKFRALSSVFSDYILFLGGTGRRGKSLIPIQFSARLIILGKRDELLSGEQ